MFGLDIKQLIILFFFLANFEDIPAFIKPAKLKQVFIYQRLSHHTDLEKHLGVSLIFFK